FGNLGLIERTRGNLGSAEAYMKLALAFSEELKYKEGMAIQLGNLGSIEYMRKNLEGAEAYHKRAWAIDKELDRKEGMACDLGNLGLIERTRGNLEEARGLWVRARDLFVEIGMPQMVEKTQAWIDGLDG
ncbi:MAG: tetratricopeptide repeat protein, partial [Phycisphaerales bacterium]|nr:tetratricopeptide repeat protein [Phycisphaerales bacterium]